MEDTQIWLAEAQAKFSEFLVNRVNPGTAERDQHGTPVSRSLLQEAASLGLLAATLPAEIGGAGYDLLRWGLALESIGYICEDNSFPLLVSLFSAVAQTIYDTGRADLIEKYVCPATRGACFVSFAWTENADAFSFASTVTRAGDEYVINAEKFLVTGGMIAHAFMIYVRDERDDVVTLLVDRDTPGVTLTPAPTMGMRAAGLAALRMEDVRVPAGQLMVSEDGIGHVQRFLNRRRVIVTCAFLGRMSRLLEETVLHLDGTIRYGLPLTAIQNVQAAIGRLYVAVETAQVVVHHALERLSKNQYVAEWDPQLSMAKYYLIERSLEVAQGALHLFGGRGYVTASQVERNLRDFFGFVAGAGAQDILEVDLGNWYISKIQREKGTAK